MPSPQLPIGSGFTAASTAEEVIAGVDLTGTTAIVTGGASGLGLETTRVLAQAGAEVIVPARDVSRAAQALAVIDRARVDELDLVDPASIDRFAERFIATGQPLQILVNSAGIMGLPDLTLDARGYELHFAINHLGHFQLTTRLLPALRAAHGARVVSVSAWAHRHSDVILEDPNFRDREYAPIVAYGQSKTANILFALALDDPERGYGIRAYSLHPGSITATNLGRHWSTDQLQAFGVLDADGEPILDPSRQLKTVAQGAATQVWCATSPQLHDIGGVYCENVEVARVVPLEERSGWGPDASTRLLGVMPYAIDPDHAEDLWTLSERMTTQQA